MKKFYVFLAAVLAMLCTVSVDAQRYSLLEEAATPEAGVTYVIKNASSNQYISCKYGLLEVMDDDDVLWQLEATGEQTEAGYDLWYLYSVGTGKYVQEVDLEGNEGLDGYDVYSYNGFNWELGDKATAMKVVIEKGVLGDDQLDDEVWRKNGPSNGYVISRQNIVYWGESPKFMKFGRQGTNVAWEPYNEDVAWQFWTVEELTDISFTDPNVKTICVTNWDTDGDGELSRDEAAAVTDLGQVFYQNKNIISFNELQFFTGLTNICNNAFDGCSKLTSINLPNSITCIGNKAFANCKSLTSITIPNSVTSIERSAFSYCTSLASVTSRITEPFAFGEDAFGLIPDNCVLYVPDGTHDAYIAAGWTEEVFKGGVVAPSDIISFADSNVKAICVANWDTDGDGELSYGEAAAVTCLRMTAFRDDTSINSFNELQYFTGLRDIENYSFRRCTNLTSIIIPNSVTNIRNGAFYGCTGLTSVTIPNSVTNIRNGAFYGCTGLTSVTIPNSVTTIGEYAFRDCSNIVSITFPDDLITIEDYAFLGCIGINCVNFSTGGWCVYNYIAEYLNAFPDTYNTPTETKYYYNRDIVYIEGTKLTELTDIVIPEGVTNIRDYAFGNCRKLTNITIPVSVKNIGYRAFYANEDVEYNVHIADLESWYNISFGSSCFSPYHLYINDEETTELDIPNFITDLSALPLSSCKWLTRVSIPSSVTAIGNNTFSGFTALQSISIPNSMTSIGNSAFNNCRSLTSVNIPNSVTTIGDNAFMSCSGLTSATIGNSVTSIGNYAFYNCTGLTSVTIPNSVTSIGNSAFSDCTSLTSVTIGNSVTSIGDDAFEGCSALTSIAIPNSVTSIGGRAFYECSSLASVTIPESVTSIGYDAFNYCWRLTRINISDLAAWCEKGLGAGFSSNYSLYLNDEKITDLIIPSAVTTIGEKAFYNCSGITTITIPNSVTSIGSYAFKNCTGLTSVSIGNSVTSIGYEVFYYCSGLKSVILQGENLSSVPIRLYDEVGKYYRYCFNESTYTQAILVVPDGTLETFQGSSWNIFTNIVEMSTQTETCTRLAALADEADTLLLQVSGTASDELVAAANTLRTLMDEARAKVSAFVAKESDIEALQTAIDAVDEIMHTHTVTYFVDGEVYATEQYREGASIAPLDEPTKEFCAFSGWSEIPEVMGTEDITVNGTFKMVYAEGYNLEFLPFALSTTGGADATCEIVFNVGSDVVQGSMVVFDLVLPSEWVANYMIDNVQKNADLGTRFYNLTDPVDNGDGTWHFTLEAKSANYYFGKVPSTKVGSFQVYQDGGGNDGNYAIAEGVYEIKLTNIYVLGSDGKVYNPAPYTGNLYVGSPKAAVEDGTVAFAGDYSAPATLGLLTSALPTDDATITAVDLTEVTALPDNTEITVANGNALVFVQEGIQLANNKNVVAGDVCENLVISDGSAFGALKAFTAENATYERSTTSRFGTICLPYAVSSDATVKYYTLDRVEGSTLYLAEETEIAAGVPAVFENVGGGSTVDASGTNVAVQGTAVLPSGGDLKLIGTYETLVITDPAELANSYYISKDQFHQATNSLTVDPFRAYFTYTGSSNSKVFNIATEDDITAVGSLDCGDAEVEGIYDVRGAKLPALQKGVNIVRYANGKTQKIIVR